jgi:16S rRNA (guanine527-N7)-methyltransferase
VTGLALRERLVDRAGNVGCSLPSAVLDQLCAYFELLKLWNRRLSLTALPIEENGAEAIDRLLLEPALAARYIPSTARTLVDIGSGGGSPALPLKIIRPDVSLMLIESREKKSAFLREVVRQLGIQGASVETARYEEVLGRPAMAAEADVVSLRAVKVGASDLIQLGQLLRRDGILMLFSAQASLLAPGTALQPIGSHALLPDQPARLEILQKT